MLMKPPEAASEYCEPPPPADAAADSQLRHALRQPPRGAADYAD